MKEEKKGITLSKKTVNGFADVVNAFDKHLKGKREKRILILNGRNYGKVNAFIERLKREGIKVVEIQQTPEIDKKWLENKTFEMIDIVSKGNILEAMRFIKSIISETQGRKK